MHQGSEKIFSVVSGILFSTLLLNAQYFGKNKPSYKSFEYKVFETPHFDIYYYLKNDTLLYKLGRLSEKWYSIQQALFNDTFKIRNPVIIYNNHDDFQQTNAINGLIDISTGGVTEALKNRVVFPLMPTFGETEHILGHELVHAFQYHILIHKDTGSLNRLRLLPLWMIEGMAEYISIGNIDSHTAMWMRDAIRNDKFPSIADMSNTNKYFPYRYGQCFWAMVGKTWGTQVLCQF